MKCLPLIKSVMAPFASSIDVDAPIEEARKFMQQHNIRHLPITEGGELVGLLSDRDIKLYLGPDMDYPKVSETKVRDVYHQDPYVVDLNEPLDIVLLTRAKKHIGSALVTREGKLTGVFTVTDACRSFAEYLRNRIRCKVGMKQFKVPLQGKSYQFIPGCTGPKRMWNFISRLRLSQYRHGRIYSQ
ncbi:MAG: CBS domain-containing protein [Gammaproteobacteria bacterium]